MDLLKPVEMKQSYLKMGIYGNAKAGKTYTGSLVAIGLHQLIKSKKPIAFFDTETGSEYVLPTLFKPAGINLVSAKSRAFSDLLSVLREAERTVDILLIDSITHVWQEIMEAYRRQNKIDFIEFQDWQPIKRQWAEFTSSFLNTKLHVIVCGRAQDIWTDSVDDRGKKQKSVTGTKMATEKNLAYEPSLLVEMEKELDPKTGRIMPRAWVVGDRFSQLDGKCFDRPTFQTFLPHIQMLNLGGMHEGIDMTRSSEGMFQAGSNENRAEYAKKKDIVLEEIKGEVDHRWPGQTGEQKTARADVLKGIFGTFSQTAIESMSLEALQQGLDAIRAGAGEKLALKTSPNGKAGVK